VKAFDSEVVVGDNTAVRAIRNRLIRLCLPEIPFCLEEIVHQVE
jgi:hypothetical protein